MGLSFTLNDTEKSFLLNQASLSIESALENKEDMAPMLPPGEGTGAFEASSALYKELGSFVTLSKDGRLRGCIGTIIGREPLYLNVWHMARAAAFQDPRFPALTTAEWPRISMEISVLDQPTPCPDPRQIVLGRDGLILQYAGHSGVFLPQVPVEQGWNLQEYLTQLCFKAGVPADSWSKPGASLYWYQALVFGEKSHA